MKANGLQSTFCLLHAKRNLGSKNEPEKKIFHHHCFQLTGMGGKLSTLRLNDYSLKILKKKNLQQDSDRY